ncbi:hypothetical protein [Paludibacterium denitrificans]|uniref:Uncharacterized protein n=1 Tax=Paludibacterium denitrificans TaxID=2675226 RepID=A0A844GGB3_9NEIS|nr:hypothetical protein [Paludibacterium denitrificans]MTD33724.1 hypothetical protein [Paludibacterium denitrificans]
MGKIIENHDVDDVSVCYSADDYVQVAKVLQDAIPRDRRAQWSGKIMEYLAKQTEHACVNGKEVPQISTKEIHMDLEGNPNQEPSARLSPRWNEIEKQRYPEIVEKLQDLCRQRGLPGYPVITKLSGKPTLYCLEISPLPEVAVTVETPDASIPAGTIRYERDLSLKLSRRGRIFANEGLKWTVGKRLSFVSWQVLVLISVLTFELFIILYIWSRHVPVTGQDLLMVLAAILAPYGLYVHFKNAVTLFDDRIVIAPEWMLAGRSSVPLWRSSVQTIPSSHLRYMYIAIPRLVRSVAG